MQDEQYYLLNVLELLESTGIDEDSSDSSSIETFSFVLLLLSELIPIFYRPMRSVDEVLLHLV